MMNIVHCITPGNGSTGINAAGPPSLSLSSQTASEVTLMNTASKSIDEYTWQSLQEYIERLIAGLLDSLAKIDSDTPPDLVNRLEEMAQQELGVLNQSLHLVVEMQRRESIQLVIPIMGVEMIRLRCRQCRDGQVRPADFAWILPVGEQVYKLVRLEFKETGEYGELWTFEGDLQQTAEKIEELVDELCGDDGL